MIKFITVFLIFAFACYLWALVLEIRECISKKNFD
jgi:hypothetical protein